ncbi:MAG: hypothetical protein B7C24_09500 [Bacteroidetes bacterium 4572_77]|nr:MAG: hypothetical protein B7C24_09500 [Bacteroidetes bacterium 4572_77]
MTNIIPRYEFRAFANNFDPIEAKMNELASVELERDINEIYLLTAGNEENNIKIRHKKMDIKVLVDKKNELELWIPQLIGEFPMKAAVLENEVYASLGISAPVFDKKEYTLKEFITVLIKEDPDVIAAHTRKIRKAYTINDCICEVADVFVNGAHIKTIAIEAEDQGKVSKTKQLLGFSKEEENLNYPMAIKRIIGLEEWPNQIKW